MALKYVSRRYYLGKVTAYFKKNGAAMRYKLLKIDETYLTKKLRVKDNYTLRNPNEVNAQIDELEERVDNAIAAILYNNPKAVINAKVIDEYLATHQEDKSVIPNAETDKLLLADFRAYNIIKEKELHEQDIKNGETRKRHPTIKDYISSANAIEDYEYDTKSQLYLSDITEDFVSDFCEWLADEHVSSKEHKYKCKGEMVNKTINKRLENLSAFIRAYYKDNTTAEMIMDGRLGDSKQTRVIALTLNEVKELYYRKLKNPNHNRIRDYFVFLCLTGLRFLDLTLLTEMNFLRQRNGRYLLSYISHKTKVEVEFELTSKAQELAIRYNFRFNEYTNQGFNRALGEMLENEHLYEDEISVIRNVLTKKIQKKMFRREKISAHTARRTFISCLIAKGVPPYQVMSMSGHKKFSTMEIYVMKFSQEMQGASKKLEF
jgi:site-specific recombinase XerD